MKTTTKKVAIGIVATGIALFSIILLLAWTGAYNFAADVQHSRPVFSAIEFARERSVRVRAADIKIPPLDDKAALVKGAGNYEAMCAQCHLVPGKADTELSRGLYPSPPNLSKVTVQPGEAFWTVKHGIKASGMPAWGKSMSDEDIWHLVAFVRKLPELNASQYSAMVKSSSGHSHAGTGDEEMQGMSHSADENAHATQEQGDDTSMAPSKPAHPHKDGEQH